MTYHCIICGEPINIRKEGLPIKKGLVCSKCLGEEKSVTKSKRVKVKSIWGEEDEL